MRQYTWDEYYEKFYDWATSTQIKYLSGLTSYALPTKLPKWLWSFVMKKQPVDW